MLMLYCVFCRDIHLPYRIRLPVTKNEITPPRIHQSSLATPTLVSLRVKNLRATAMTDRTATTAEAVVVRCVLASIMAGRKMNSVQVA
jgi:hypothetical protein